MSRGGRGLWERLLASRRQVDDGDPDPPVWAPRALVIVAATIAVDLLMVIFSYAIARAVWPAHRSPDFSVLARVSPVILATILCWPITFQLFGLYDRKRVLGPSLDLPRLLEAISVSIFAVIVVAFATGDEMLHRGWVVVLWIVATVLVVLGRLVMHGLAQFLNQDLARPARQAPNRDES